jgi:hypothetical protein
MNSLHELAKLFQPPKIWYLYQHVYGWHYGVIVPEVSPMPSAQYRKLEKVLDIHINTIDLYEKSCQSFIDQFMQYCPRASMDCSVSLENFIFIFTFSFRSGAIITLTIDLIDDHVIYVSGDLVMYGSRSLLLSQLTDYLNDN